MVTITLYARQQKRHRCIQVFWTLCPFWNQPLSDGKEAVFLYHSETELHANLFTDGPEKGLDPIFVAQIDQKQYQQHRIDDGLGRGLDLIAKYRKGGVEHTHTKCRKEKAQLFIGEAADISTDKHRQKGCEHNNQIYIRGEAYIGWGILIPAAFARIGDFQ